MKSSHAAIAVFVVFKSMCGFASDTAVPGEVKFVLRTLDYSTLTCVRNQEDGYYGTYVCEAKTHCDANEFQVYPDETNKIKIPEFENLPANGLFTYTAGRCGIKLTKTATYPTKDDEWATILVQRAVVSQLKDLKVLLIANLPVSN